MSLQGFLVILYERLGEEESTKDESTGGECCSGDWVA